METNKNVNRKSKVVRGKDREEKTYFTIKKGIRNYMAQPMNQKNLMLKSRNMSREKKGFSSSSLKILTVKNFGYQDTGTSSYCISYTPKCK